MQIIMFTGDSPDKILLREKDMTARHWRRTPPPVGSLFRAQRGRKTSTAFAICEVVNVWEWDGLFDGNAWEVTGLFCNEIAKREGFQNWGHFHGAYYDLNAHNWDDPKRSHYFIEFVMVREVL